MLPETSLVRISYENFSTSWCTAYRLFVSYLPYRLMRLERSKKHLISAISTSKLKQTLLLSLFHMISHALIASSRRSVTVFWFDPDNWPLLIAPIVGVSQGLLFSDCPFLSSFHVRDLCGDPLQYHVILREWVSSDSSPSLGPHALMTCMNIRMIPPLFHLH